MINAWTTEKYLQAANLKAALDTIKRSRENKAVTPVGLAAHTDTTATAAGLGGFCTIGEGGTFSYRIEDVIYQKGAALIGNLVPHDTTDNTAAGAYDITAGYYRAGCLLIDGAGTVTKVYGALSNGSAGGQAKAIANLISVLTTTDLSTKAVIGFFIIGDGSSAFIPTSSLTISTNLQLYSCGGTVLSSGLSSGGDSLIAAL